MKDITTLYEIVSIILSYVQKNNLNQDKANSDIILSDNSLSLVLRHNGKYVNKRIKVFHPGQIIKLIRKDLKYQRPPFCHALKMSKEIKQLLVFPRHPPWLLCNRRYLISNQRLMKLLYCFLPIDIWRRNETGIEIQIIMTAIFDYLKKFRRDESNNYILYSCKCKLKICSQLNYVDPLANVLKLGSCFHINQVWFSLMANGLTETMSTADLNHYSILKMKTKQSEPSNNNDFNELKQQNNNELFLEIMKEKNTENNQLIQESTLRYCSNLEEDLMKFLM